MGQPKIHEKKNFARESVEDVSFRLMFRGHRCTGCGSDKPVLRIQTFVAIDDIVNLSHRAAARLLATSGEWDTVMLRGSGGTPRPGVRAAEVYACQGCSGEANRAAARGPSFAVHTFDGLDRTRGSQVIVSAG